MTASTYDRERRKRRRWRVLLAAWWRLTPEQRLYGCAIAGGLALLLWVSVLVLRAQVDTRTGLGGTLAGAGEAISTLRLPNILDLPLPGQSVIVPSVDPGPLRRAVSADTDGGHLHAELDTDVISDTDIPSGKFPRSVRLTLLGNLPRLVAPPIPAPHFDTLRLVEIILVDAATGEEVDARGLDVVVQVEIRPVDVQKVRGDASRLMLWHFDTRAGVWEDTHASVRGSYLVAHVTNLSPFAVGYVPLEGGNAAAAAAGIGTPRPTATREPPTATPAPPAATTAPPSVTPAASPSAVSTPVPLAAEATPEPPAATLPAGTATEAAGTPAPGDHRDADAQSDTQPAPVPPGTPVAPATVPPATLAATGTALPPSPSPLPSITPVPSPSPTRAPNPSSGSPATATPTPVPVVLLLTTPGSGGRIFDVPNMQPGQDTAANLVVRNDGDVDFTYTLRVDATTSSRLDTDPVNGLQLTLLRCGASFTLCTRVVYSGPTVAANIPMSGPEYIGPIGTLVLGLRPGSDDYLQMRFSFPSNAPNQLQNNTTVLRFTWTATQFATATP